MSAPAPTAPAEHSPPSTTSSRSRSRSRVVDQAADWIRPDSPAAVVQRIMLSLLVLAVVVLAVANPTFRQQGNLLNILQQASMVGIVACGMQLMIVSGGFDLSVGVTAAAAGCAAAYVSMNNGLLLGTIAGLLVGLVAGVANGVLIAKLDINPFVATFGSQAVITGVLYAATDAKPVAPLPAEWVRLGLWNVGGLSFASLVFVGVIFILLFVLRSTMFGQHIYAVGSNKEGARRAGISVDRVLLAVYAIGGFCAAIAGILLVAISGIGSPGSGTQWALLAIAAVIIGGTPLTGGVGGISSAVIGILALTVLTNALNLYGVSAFWQPALMGGAVLLAVGYEAFRRRRRR